MNSTNTLTLSASAAWFHAHHDLPSVFVSIDAVIAAMYEYPGERDFGDVLRDFEAHGAYTYQLRMRMNGVSLDTPEPCYIDRDPSTPEELYAWLFGFAMADGDLDSLDDDIREAASLNYS